MRWIESFGTMEKSRGRRLAHGGILWMAPICLWTMTSAAIGQPVTTYGTLSNFDCVNDTDHECHGFEIELEDVFDYDVVYEFGAPYERYGDPIVIPTATGCIVRYASGYDSVNHTWAATTPGAISPYPPTMGHQCWTLGDPNYPNSGCEHFGISTTRNPTRTTYRWLIEDPQNPGSLTPLGSNVNIPAPVWNVVPQPAGPPVVMAVIPAPPPEIAGQFGEAIWEKIYVMESPDPVDLNDLVLGGAAVPDPDVEAPEVEWQLLQSPPEGQAGKNAESENGGQVGEGAEAVSRRYEFYKYTGQYDPENHEALCDDPLSGDPACGPVDPKTGLAGIGDLIGAQNAAVNLVQPPVQPQITCPDAIMQIADPEMCSAIVNYPDPIVTPPDTPFGCDPPSGATFPAGITTVNCIAFNEAGQADCGFDVTIVENSLGCDDANDCTLDDCFDGSCRHQPIEACCNADGQCDDGDVCTSDTCVGHACSHEKAPDCCNADGDCTDGNDCTYDSCVNHACQNESIEGCCLKDDDCDDQAPCTADTCVDHQCRHSEIPDCGHMPGDCDDDKHLDLADFAMFQNCFAGADITVHQACECADLNSDGHVDLTDLSAFDGAMTGP